MKEYPKLLGNRLSIMLNNISARKYPIGLVPRFIWVFSRSETAHGSAIILCKILQSMAVFLRLNVDLLKPYKSVLFVKRKTSLRVVSNFRYGFISADGDSVRVSSRSYGRHCQRSEVVHVSKSCA